MPACPRCNHPIEKGRKDCPRCLPAPPSTWRSPVIGLCIVGVAALWLLTTQWLVPRGHEREAIRRVRSQESELLDSFVRRARQTNVQIIGWETDMAYPICLVTYVYNDQPSTPTRKAFWWVVDLSRPEDGSGSSVTRLRSIDDFVDNHLLPGLLE